MNGFRLRLSFALPARTLRADAARGNLRQFCDEAGEVSLSWPADVGFGSKADIPRPCPRKRAFVSTGGMFVKGQFKLVQG